MATPTQRIYNKPFCNSGNKVTIPTDEPVTLEVNQETGYTPPYSQELGGLYIEREAFNGIINATQQQTLINADGIDAINEKLETDYVSKAGNEIINGSKTFANAITCNGRVTNLKHLATVEKCNALIKPTDDKANTNAQAIANINNQLTTKVSLTDNQTIAGAKTFANAITCNGTITGLKHLTTLEKVNQLVKVTDDKVATNTQAIANINNQLTTKVSLTGNQTIAGVKTFSSNVIIPNATANTHALNLQTANSKYVALSGNQTIAGVKTFSSIPLTSVNASANNQLVNWQTLQAQITAKSGKVALKGTRTTNGSWTITGLTPYKPLFLIINGLDSSQGYYGVYCGIAPGASVLAGSLQNLLGYSPSDGDDSSNNAIYIPTRTSVVVEVVEINKVSILAFQ